MYAGFMAAFFSLVRFNAGWVVIICDDFTERVPDKTAYAAGAYVNNVFRVWDRPACSVYFNADVVPFAGAFGFFDL